MQWRLTMAAALLLSSSVLAQRHPEGGLRPGPRGFERELLAYLELTPDQESSIRDLRHQHRQTAGTWERSLREVHHQLREAMEQPDPEPRSLGLLLLEGRDLRHKLHQEREGFELQVLELLNPEQKTKYQNMRELARLRRESRFRGESPRGPSRRPPYPGSDDPESVF